MDWAAIIAVMAIGPANPVNGIKHLPAPNSFPDIPNLTAARFLQTLAVDMVENEEHGAPAILSVIAGRDEAPSTEPPDRRPKGVLQMRWVIEEARRALPSEVISLPADRRHLAADFLARACADHPILPYIVPVRALRTRLALAEAGLALLDFAEHGGEVDVTQDRLDGMAVWLTPGSSWTAPARRARALRLAAALGMGPDGFLRCLRLAIHLERISHRHLGDPYRELLLLAIHPARRDRGIEELLLRSGLARADAEGTPVATVAFQAAPVLFYVKFGFQVVGEGELPGVGPRYWLLARQPQPRRGG